MRSGVRKALARRVLLADRRTPVRDREGRRPDDDPSLPAAGKLISQWKALLCGSSGRKSVDFMEAPERAPAARELHLRPPARIRFSLTNEGRDGCLSRFFSNESMIGRIAEPLLIVRRGLFSGVMRPTRQPCRARRSFERTKSLTFPLRTTPESCSVRPLVSDGSGRARAAGRLPGPGGEAECAAGCPGGRRRIPTRRTRRRSASA